MHITFVKKITVTGEACRKCADVEQRLHDSGHWSAIDTVLIADQRDANSAGNHLANAYGVERAPFFVVEHDGGEISVYTVYFKFVAEVLNQIVPDRATYETACS
ncbi:MAG: hypothetical protein ACI9BW_004687 [Gammaproteobacteria bacterium]|jgi:hypothetical protein